MMKLLKWLPKLQGPVSNGPGPQLLQDSPTGRTSTILKRDQKSKREAEDLKPHI